MIVYESEGEYPYTSIPQDREIYPCLCYFIPYLGAILWYVRLWGETIYRSGELFVQL